MIRYRRLLDAVRAGAPAETCPVFFWKHHPVADQRADTLCAATMAFQERFDCDLVKISPAATYQLPDYGLIDAWRGDPIGRRAVERTVIHDPEDWLDLPRLNPRAGFTGQFVACATEVRRAQPSHVPVIITVFNPLFQAATLAGLDLLRRHMRDCPDAVAAGLERLLDNTLGLIDCLVGQGVDGIFLASQHAEADTFSADLYATHGLPGDLACLRAAEHLPYSMFHLHGAGVHPTLFGRPPAVMLHYDPSLGNPPPQTLLAAEHAVSTGPSPALLASDGPDWAVAAACEAIIEPCKGKGFILSPGCSVPLAVGAGRLDAITAAARQPRADRPR